MKPEFGVRVLAKYEKAIEKYPDLKELPIKLAAIAYDFREYLLREHRQGYTNALANGRSNITVGCGAWRQALSIASDLPAFDFDKECVVCFENKRGINICPECWERLRKCLELKAEQHRPGWEGWGKEMSLDLRPLVELLETDEEGRKLVEASTPDHQIRLPIDQSHTDRA